MLLFLVVAALLLLVLLLLLFLLFLLLQLLYCTRHRHLLSSLLFSISCSSSGSKCCSCMLWTDRPHLSPLPSWAVVNLFGRKSFLQLLFGWLCSFFVSFPPLLLPLLFYTIYILFIHIYIFVRVCGACVPVFVYCLRIYYFECDVI